MLLAEERQQIVEVRQACNATTWSSARRATCRFTSNDLGPAGSATEP